MGSERGDTLSGLHGRDLATKMPALPYRMDTMLPDIATANRDVNSRSTIHRGRSPLGQAINRKRQRSRSRDRDSDEDAKSLNPLWTIEPVRGFNTENVTGSRENCPCVAFLTTSNPPRLNSENSPIPDARRLEPHQFLASDNEQRATSATDIREQTGGEIAADDYPIFAFPLLERAEESESDRSHRMAFLQSRGYLDDGGDLLRAMHESVYDD